MKTKLELIAEEVLKYSPSIVVDIGYAQVPNTHLHDVKVYGVDLVEAPAPYEKTFVCDLNRDPLPFKDGEIDAVAMGCTLAHVANPLKVLGEVNRILRAGGGIGGVVSQPKLLLGKRTQHFLSSVQEPGFCRKTYRTLF